ncbi:MAG: energy transducer TonB [Mucilaginibacter sp.]
MKRLLFVLITTACSSGALAQTTNLAIANTTNVDDQIYTTPVEVMPEYKGGMDRFYNKLKTIQYLYYARMQNIQGRVMVSMLIEKDGTLSKAKVMNGLIEEQDKEILRVVHNLRHWKPGMHNGQPVRVVYNVPLNFKLVPIPERID